LSPLIESLIKSPLSSPSLISLFVNCASLSKSEEKEVKNDGIIKEEESRGLKGRKRGKGTLKGIQVKLIKKLSCKKGKDKA
jgi:hypothetical protein